MGIFFKFGYTKGRKRTKIVYASFFLRHLTDIGTIKIKYFKIYLIKYQLFNVT